MSISKRARKSLQAAQSPHFPLPEGPYYDAELHPDGVINLSTAENSLMFDEIQPLLSRGQIRSQHLKYRSALLRSSIPQLADLLPRYVNMTKPVVPVTRANSVSGPGIGALLAQLIWTLCEEGDGVLLSTPYYHDYARDIRHPARAIPVLAHIPSGIDSLSPAVLPFLEDRIMSSKLEGVPVRALILCNPHNPIPRCYPIETVEGYLKLAEKFGLHLIVDEIFANTIFSTKQNPHPVPFISVLSLPIWSIASPLLERIHVLAGPTKDLGCSGLKAGLLISSNESVRKVVSAGLMATPISGATDAALSEVLRDEDRLRTILARNASALGNAMDLCADWATFHGLPYVSANAGVFFIIDFSPIAISLGLAGPSEAELMRRMINCKVHINPTTLDLDNHRNRFRFIISQKPEILKLALRRLELAFGLEEFDKSSPH